MALNRRTFCTSMLAVAGTVSASGADRTMKTHLTPGSIGVKADQDETIELAARHGYEAVEPYGEYLAGLSTENLATLLARLKEHNLVFGSAGLPVEFRRSEEQFKTDVAKLPAIAAGLQRAGVTRVGTWLSPTHDSLTYLKNFNQHVTRLRECAAILGDHNQRLGLEYVGPKLSWSSRKYPFIHTLAEMKELIAAIGRQNVGFVLDSWHWYTAGETTEDLLTLRNQDVVSVDLNDAPSGLAVEEQKDNQRELPCATGVIDVGAFLNALQRLGYDGPVRPEPFNEKVRSLGRDEAVAVSAAAMKKAFALIRV